MEADGRDREASGDGSHEPASRRDPTRPDRCAIQIRKSLEQGANPEPEPGQRRASGVVAVPNVTLARGERWLVGARRPAQA
jgi:hypothetical protein